MIPPNFLMRICCLFFTFMGSLLPLETFNSAPNFESIFIYKSKLWIFYFSLSGCLSLSMNKIMNVIILRIFRVYLHTNLSSNLDDFIHFDIFSLIIPNKRECKRNQKNSHVELGSSVLLFFSIWHRFSCFSLCLTLCREIPLVMHNLCGSFRMVKSI